MKKIFSMLIIFTVCLLFSFDTEAIKKFEDLTPQKSKLITLTGFYTYPPFGSVAHIEYKEHGKFSSIFNPAMKIFADENKLDYHYATNAGTYEESIQKTRRGEVDLVLGMYHESERYKGIEYVYPAAISNPVTVMMMPDRIDEVKTLKDLEKLKGVVSQDEYFSDYVAEQIKRFNIQKQPNSYTLFEKLFIGEADYVIGSQYYLLLEATKLGIADQIGTAKQTLWNMPLFLGVSKLSTWRNFLTYKLTRFIGRPEIQKMIQDELAAEIKKVQEENKGVVPPPYIRTQTEEDKAPSQENQKEEAEKQPEKDAAKASPATDKTDKDTASASASAE